MPQEEKQKKLREKYETPEDVLIVEKDNTVKFFVRTTGNVIKLVVGMESLWMLLAKHFCQKKD